MVEHKTGISNRILYTLIAGIILIIAGIGVYALVPGTAPNPGHTIDQLAPPTGCGNGTFLKWNTDNGGFWSCGAASTSWGEDHDGDGFIAINSGGTDCNDNNVSVHPKQTMYFYTPYTIPGGGTSWDYDCSGSEEKKYNSVSTRQCPQPSCAPLGHCTDDGSQYGTAGWSAGVPACGATGTYETYCGPDLAADCEQQGEMRCSDSQLHTLERTQACH